MAAKETVLEDSASIYQKREEKSEKQKWSEMDRAARWTYFNQYYRNKLIWLVIGVIAGISLLYSIFGSSVEQVLYVAVINDLWSDAATEALEEDLEVIFEADPKWEEAVFDDSYFFISEDSSGDPYNYMQKLAAYIFAGDVDLIISDEEQFEVYAVQDYFLNLEEVLPADVYTEVKDYLVYYPSELEGRELPVGVRLGESPVYKSLNCYQEDPILGIMSNTEYRDNAIETIRYFFTSDADYSNVEPIEEE